MIVRFKIRIFSKTEFTHVIRAAAESTFGKINKLEWFNQIIKKLKLYLIMQSMQEQPAFIC